MTIIANKELRLNLMSTMHPAMRTRRRQRDTREASLRPFAIIYPDGSSTASPLKTQTSVSGNGPPLLGIKRRRPCVNYQRRLGRIYVAHAARDTHESTIHTSPRNREREKLFRASDGIRFEI